MPQANGQAEYVVGIKSYPNRQYFLKGGSKFSIKSAANFHGTFTVY